MPWCFFAQQDKKKQTKKTASFSQVFMKIFSCLITTWCLLTRPSRTWGRWCVSRNSDPASPTSGRAARWDRGKHLLHTDVITNSFNKGSDAYTHIYKGTDQISDCDAVTFFAELFFLFYLIFRYFSCLKLWNQDKALWKTSCFINNPPNPLTRAF